MKMARCGLPETYDDDDDVCVCVCVCVEMTSTRVHHRLSTETNIPAPPPPTTSSKSLSLPPELTLSSQVKSVVVSESSVNVYLPLFSCDIGVVVCLLLL